MSPSENIPCPECGGPMNYLSSRCRKCRYPGTGTDDSPFPMSGTERAKYGCICTFENADGKTLAIHRKGAATKALREACEVALQLDPTFLLVAYSNPTTIWQDLQGHRMSASRSSDAVTGSDRTTMPEAQLLGLIGMRKMLHPRLSA